MSTSLEAARIQLPAAHFISDEDLAHILTLSTPAEVEGRNYFSRLFSGVVGVKTDAGQNIVAIVDSVGNTVNFAAPIATKGKTVLVWLSDLRAAIPRQLRTLALEACANDSEASLPVLATKYPVQIAILVLELRYAIRMNKALESSSLSPVLAALSAEVAEAVKAVRSSLSSHEHKNLSTLMTVAISQADRAQRLAKILAEDSLGSARQAWSQVLQFTFDVESSQVIARCGSTSIPYGFHFVSADRLVRSTITDYIYYTTLTSKVAVVIRGAAGTGKTEVQKDLAADLGYESVVVNCSEKSSPAALEALSLVAEANPGTVLIFDEFNRYFVGQPSAAVSLLQRLTEARRCGRIPLWTAFTYNPHNEGSSLPTGDASVIETAPPDLLPIIRVLFATEGISEYESAAGLTLEFLAWAKGALSPQPVYDWGLRAIKATSQAAGRLFALGSSEGVLDCLRRALDVAVVARLTVEDRVAAEEQLAKLLGRPALAPLTVSVGEKTSAISGDKLGQVWLSIVRALPTQPQCINH